MYKILRLIMLSAVLLTGLTTGCAGGSAPTPSAQPVELASNFRLPNLEGETISLADLRGKPVLINFWATWCNPCREEMPFIQEIFEDKEWSDKGLVVLAIDVGEEASVVRGFMENYGLSFTVLLDSNKEITARYNIRGIPTTFFVDKEDMVRDVKFGAFSGREEIERTLLDSIID